ncbi:MAG: 50S ribosomal protein L33 [bacterium]|nr:50S ribosomal protein L33 [bacterium]
MASKSKEVRINILLECTECRKNNMPGVARYATSKNKRNTPDRIELKKYCKFERKVTLFKEVK